MFRTGHKKVGGRKKGTPNKRTEEFKKALDDASFNIPDEALRMYRLLPAEPLFINQRMEILKFLAAYSYPKPTSCSEDSGVESGIAYRPLANVSTDVLLERVRKSSADSSL